MSRSIDLLDVRALDLDHDVVRAVGRLEVGAVHLADRRRRERLGIEALEDLLDRRAELRLDLRTHLVERDRRHLVLELLELVDDVRSG